MSKYIKFFGTKEEYKNEKDNLLKPNVSFIENTGDLILSGQSIKEMPEYVDLGLSVKWASYNLGAQNIEDEGLYFSWGNIIGHTYNEGYNFNDTNYNSTPGKSLTTDIPVNATYDAARAIKGEPWRIPTKTEFIELYNNTTSIWTSVNKKSGRLFVSKINGNCIFIPAAGYFYGSSSRVSFGACGCYWSSTRVVSTYAYGLYFGSGYVDPENYDRRYCGFPVRPVQ